MGLLVTNFVRRLFQSRDRQAAEMAPTVQCASTLANDQAQVFVIRPDYSAGKPLIEFRGNHRAPDFPSVLRLLEQALPGFNAKGEEPCPDEFVWTISYTGGEFELCDDWGGLFVLPRSNHDAVIADVSAALIVSGSFQHVGTP